MASIEDIRKLLAEMETRSENRHQELLAEMKAGMKASKEEIIMEMRDELKASKEETITEMGNGMKASKEETIMEMSTRTVKNNDDFVVPKLNEMRERLGDIEKRIHTSQGPGAMRRRPSSEEAAYWEARRSIRMAPFDNGKDPLKMVMDFMRDRMKVDSGTLDDTGVVQIRGVYTRGRTLWDPGRTR